MEAFFPNMFFAKVGTVIVNLGYKASCVYGRCRVPCGSDATTPSTCECREHTRTRQFCQISGCDSEVVRRKPWRKSNLFTRYVNVFSAVCILLVIGALLPQSSAAPHRLSKKTERTKSAMAHSENPLWSNPCDYQNDDDIPELEYKAVRASNIAAMARNERYKAAAYRNNFSSTIHSFNDFEQLLPMWENTEWLRNYEWFEDTVLPISKKFNEPLPDDYFSEQYMENIDAVLPVQYKALKMIVAALDTMEKEGFNDQPTSYLRPNITQTKHGVRGVLCGFKELLHSRNLRILTIDSDEIPHFDGGDSARMMLLVYRDTLNLLHYLEQQFDIMANTVV